MNVFLYRRLSWVYPVMATFTLVTQSCWLTQEIRTGHDLHILCAWQFRKMPCKTSRLPCALKRKRWLRVNALQLRFSEGHLLFGGMFAICSKVTHIETSIWIAKQTKTSPYRQSSHFNMLHQENFPFLRINPASGRIVNNIIAQKCRSADRSLCLSSCNARFGSWNFTKMRSVVPHFLNKRRCDGDDWIAFAAVHAMH